MASTNRNTAAASASAPAGRDSHHVDPANVDQMAGQKRTFQPERKRRLACSFCRQSKLKCETESAEEPCQRCHKLGLNCVYDTEYKRINKRLKIRELVEEVEQLRSAVHNRPQSHGQAQSLASPPDSSGTAEQSSDLSRPRVINGDSSVATTNANTPYQNPEPPSSPRVPGAGHTGHSTDCRPATLSSRTIEGVTLSSSQIDHLFDAYFRHYHEYMPILDPSTSADEWYNLSVLLFWTIILIGSRKDKTSPGLMQTLDPSLRRLLWITAGSPPNTRFEIKAMTLLCIWPLGHSSLTTDPSYLIASVAKCNAMQVGLHRPEIVHDYCRVKYGFDPEELRDTIKTWAACFVAAESVTNFLGQPSLFQSDVTIEHVCQPKAQQHRLPCNLYILVQAFYLANRCHRVMAYREKKTGKLSEQETSVLLRLLEADFEGLRLLTAPSVVLGTELAILYAGLQLRCYYFFDALGSASRKEGLLKCYATAVTIPARAQELDTGCNALEYAPAWISDALIMSAMLIWKIVKSSFVKYIDIEAGERMFDLCLRLLSKAALHDTDVRAKGVKLLKQLWTFKDPSMLSKEPDLRVKTRLGGSLLHDTLWIWRENFTNYPKLYADQASSKRGPRYSTKDGNMRNRSDDEESLDSQTVSQQQRKAQAPTSINEAMPQTDSMNPLANEATQLPDWTSNAATNQLPNSLFSGDSAPMSFGQNQPSDNAQMDFDFALMPEDYADGYWDTRLDGFMSFDMPSFF